MQYLAFVEQDGTAWGGFIPELHASATGKNREQVLERLAQGATFSILALAEEGRPVPQAVLQSTTDLRPEDREDVQGMEAVFVTPAQVSSTSVAIAQAIEHSGLSRAEVARRMGTSSAAVTRITDMFYFEHSLHTLRQLSGALGLPIARFVDLKDLAMDEYLAHGDGSAYTPGHITLKRTPELERLELPALVRWEGLLFWLDRPSSPPFSVSNADHLVFEGSMVDDHGYTRSIMSLVAG